MTRFAAIWCLILGVAQIHAQERSVSITAKPNEIRIGEQFQIEWKLKSHATDTVDLPVLNDSVFSNFEFLEESHIDTTYDSIDITQRIISKRFLATAFDSGYYPIPPIEVQINGSPVFTDPMLISVYTVDVDTTQAIKDIRNVASMPFSISDWIREYWYWPAGIMGLTSVVLLLIYILKRRRKPIVAERPEIKVPPHVWALEELQKLEDKKLWQNGNFKGYYSDLTDVLRGYIELRFHIAAMELTSVEILQSIRHEPQIDQEQQSKLRKLLSLADLVKFAKEKPLPAENEAGMGTVKQFVLATKKEPAQEEEESGGAHG